MKKKLKKKLTCDMEIDVKCTVGVAYPLDHRVKIKENAKREKYLDFAKELRKCQRSDSEEYKGVISKRQCIVRFVGTGRRETPLTKR